MLSESCYTAESLLTIQSEEHSYHPELFLKKQIVVSQRSFLKSVLHALQGLQSEVFVRTQASQTDQESSFIMRPDVQLTMSHLSAETLKQCTTVPLRMANHLHYLKRESLHIYETCNNLIVKSFIEGVLSHQSRVLEEITAVLTQVQMEDGQIHTRYMERTESEADYYTQKEYMTLIHVCSLIESKMRLLPTLVQIVKRVKPYLSDNKFAPKNGLVHLQSTQLLMDQFSAIIGSLPPQSVEYGEFITVFESCLCSYLCLVEAWIEMDPYRLESMSEQPFFVKWSEIDFNISKQLSQTCKQLTKENRRQQRQFSAYYQSREEVTKNIHNSSQLFFKIHNLLISEYTPELFKEQAKRVLQLGKIIQFISLFFTVDERPSITGFFNIRQEFEPLKRLLNKYSDQKTPFFRNQNKRKNQTLSQRMKAKRKAIIKPTKTSVRNPFAMLPETEGVFIEKLQVDSKAFDIETEQKPLENQVAFEGEQEFKNNIKGTEKIKESRIQRNSKIPFGHMPINMSFSFEFKHTLAQILNRIQQKALQFFKTSFNSMSIALENHSVKEQENHDQNFERPSNQEVSRILEMKVRVPSWDRIVKSIDLTLRGIEKFMLFEQGDFILQLTHLVSGLFETSYQKISRSLLNSYIEQAIGSSSANALPIEIRRNITFTFLKKGKDSSLRHLKGWTVFSIVYQPEYPLNCLFTDEVMSKFAEVFNFIFNVKKCEFFLKNVWDEFKDNAKIATQYSLFQVKRHPFECKILAIRNNLHHFVNCVYSYLLIRVQKHWKEFKENRTQREEHEKPFNPIQTLGLLHQVTNQLKHETVDNIALSNIMVLASELIDKLRKLLKIGQDSKEWNESSFRQELDHIGHEFTGIMEMAKTVEGVGDAVNYSESTP